MKEVNISFLFHVFKKCWWKILIVAVVVMLLAACFTNLVIPKKYSSSVKFYVVNVNTSVDYTQATYLMAAEYLINDYIEIINGDRLLTLISDSLKDKGYANVTPNALRGMISSSSKSETSAFTITVTHTDKNLAYYVADLIAKEAPAVVTQTAKPVDQSNAAVAAKVEKVLSYLPLDKRCNIEDIYLYLLETGKYSIDAAEVNARTMYTILQAMEAKTALSREDIEQFLVDHGEEVVQLNAIDVLKAPERDTKHDSPNLVTNVILAGMIAVVLVYGICLIRSFIVSTITTEEDLKELVKRPLIGAIPHWDSVEIKK